MTLSRLERALIAIFALCVLLALGSSLALSIAYKGQVNTYKAQVNDLRGALSVSCQNRTVQHNALRSAQAAEIHYFETQLHLLDANYQNQLKIITSYPKAAQAKAIARVNDNRSALVGIITKDRAAYQAGAVFICAH